MAIVNGDMLEVPLPSENASLVVAGVGAHLICRFIKRVPLGSNLTLVLGPNKNPDEVERALKDLGWHITSQEVLIEKGRERTVFTAIVEGSIELQRAGDRRNQ